MSDDLDVHLPAIRGGDAEAFGAWLVAAEPSLRRGLRSFAREVDVEAVLQEACLRTWQVAPRFAADGKPNGLVRLTHTIARNLAISELRKRARERPVDPELLASGRDAELAYEPSLPDPLLRATIQGCRDKLPPQPGRALAARLEAGGQVADATLAAGLALRKDTFLRNLSRARALLLECLRRAGVELGLP
ncbi:MAG: sigma factor [Planctomycetota bacterium]